MLARTFRKWPVLAVLLLALGVAAPPTAGASPPSLTLREISQTTTVTVGNSAGAVLQLGLDLGSDPAHTQLSLTLYGRFFSRFALLQSMATGQVPTSPLSTTGYFSTPCRRAGTVTLRVGVDSVGDTASGNCGATALALRLYCPAGHCSGVYPLVVAARAGTAARKFLTYVTVTEGAVVEPLRVAWVPTLSPSGSAAITHDVSALNALQYAPFPLGLALSTGATSSLLTSSEGSAALQALSNYHSLSSHQFVATLPSGIDWSALSGHDFSNITKVNLASPSIVLGSLARHAMSEAVFLPGLTTSADLHALAQNRVTRILVNDSSLSLMPSHTLSWGSPFRSAPGQAATCADTELAAVLRGPASAASKISRLSAVLSMMYFQSPYAPSARTVILSTPLESLSPTVVRGVSDLLSHSPLLSPVSLDQALLSAAIGTNGNPATRSFAPSASSAWTSSQLATLHDLQNRAFSVSEATDNVAAQSRILDALTAVAARGSSRDRDLQILRATTVLDAITGQVVINQSTLTLADATGSLPITVLSHSSYPIAGILHLNGSRIRFNGTNSYSVSLQHAVNVIPISITVSGAGNTALTAEILTPDGRSVIAHTIIEIRRAPTSVVGYVLSLGSLLILGLWWWRTAHRRRRTPRHA